MSQGAFLESIGLAASVLVALSLLMTSVVKLRWINLAGAIVFSVYGILIESVSVTAVNVFITGVNIYHLNRVYSNKEKFRGSFIHYIDNEYLADFLEYYKEDIRHHCPSFDFKLEEEFIVLFVHRNMNIAGLFIAEIKDPGSLHVLLDYVVPKYRDFKVAKFIYQEKKSHFQCLGFDTLYSDIQNEKHNRYLEKVGFKRQAHQYVLHLGDPD